MSNIYMSHILGICSTVKSPSDLNKEVNLEKKKKKTSTTVLQHTWAVFVCLLSLLSCDFFVGVKSMPGLVN